MKNKITIIFFYIILAFIFVFLTFDFYLSKDNYLPSSDAFFYNPSKYDATKTIFTGSVINVSNDFFYMKVNQKSLKVYFQGLEEPKFGQMEAIVILNSDGTAQALRIHNFNYNYVKYIVSLFALFIFLYIFFSDWKIKNWRFIKNA